MSAGLRVLALSTLFPNAAAPNFGIFVERQLAALAARDGVEVSVVAPLGLPPFPLDRLTRHRDRARILHAEDWHELEVSRPRFLALPLIGARTNPRAIARAVLPLARRLHARRPFSIVTADFCFPDGPAAQRIARALGLPFTMKARGNDIHHFGTIAPARRQMLAAARDASALLAVSAALRDDMAALGIAKERIAVHYTGCDQQRFAPAEKASARAALGITGPLVVSVGALIARKRHALLVEALPRLPDVTLAIAGSGPEEASLRALARSLGVTDRLRLLGPVAHDDMPGLINAADVMALVSQSEGLANAWVEALACGVPIVISDAGGAAELLRDPVAGRIVGADPHAIADAILDIMARPADPAAVRATVSDFTWSRNAEALERILRGAIAR